MFARFGEIIGKVASREVHTDLVDDLYVGTIFQ
jgi:hypothetical protein